MYRLKANKEVSAFHNTLKRIGGIHKMCYLICFWRNGHSENTVDVGCDKNISGDQKAETAAIAELAITIKADSPELGEKVDHNAFTQQKTNRHSGRPAAEAGQSF